MKRARVRIDPQHAPSAPQHDHRSRARQWRSTSVQRGAAEPRRVNGPCESSAQPVPAAGSSGELASSTLPLRGVATGVQHGDDDNDVRFDGEVDGIREAPEKGATNAAA